MTESLRRELVGVAGGLSALISFDQPLARLTTWRIGGPAEVILQPHDRDGLVLLLAWLREHGVPWRPLGGGSNLLAPDSGVRGVVLAMARSLAAADWQGTELLVEAGFPLPKLSREAADRGLSGLECVVGVPGTLGGGCVTNAGLPTGTLGDALVEVEALSSDGERLRLARADLELGHRTSIFRSQPLLVLAARLALTPEEPERIRERLREHMDYRRRTQPLKQPSCGSVFRRPAEGYPGALIEQAGCKGLTRGAAQVSELHANWIVNLGGASAADVRWLIGEVRRRVFDASGVRLELEVELWPEVEEASALV